MQVWTDTIKNWKPNFFSVPRPTDELPCTPPSESQRALYSALVSRIQEEPLKGMVGPDCVTGSNLPSHSDIHTSCLTGLKIQVQFQWDKVFLPDSVDCLWGCHKLKVPPTIWLVKGLPCYHRSRIKGDRQWHLLYKKGYIEHCPISACILLATPSPQLE